MGQFEAPQKGKALSPYRHLFVPLVSDTGIIVRSIHPQRVVEFAIANYGDGERKRFVRLFSYGHSR